MFVSVTALSIVGALTTVLHPASTHAQSSLSYSQAINSTKRTCTFRKTEVTTWKTETGTSAIDSRTYNALDYGCTKRVLRGRSVNGVLRYDRARSWSGIITFKA